MNQSSFSFSFFLEGWGKSLSGYHDHRNLQVYRKFLVGKNKCWIDPVIGQSNRHKYHSKQSLTGNRCAELRESIHRQKKIYSRDAAFQIYCHCGWHGPAPGTRAVRAGKRLLPAQSTGHLQPRWTRGEQAEQEFCELSSRDILGTHSSHCFSHHLPSVPGENDNFQLYLAAYYCDNLHKD